MTFQKANYQNHSESSSPCVTSMCKTGIKWPPHLTINLPTYDVLIKMISVTQNIQGVNHLLNILGRAHSLKRNCPVNDLTNYWCHWRHHMSVQPVTKYQNDDFFASALKCIRNVFHVGWVGVGKGVIRFDGLSRDSEQRGPYSPYKTYKHSLYIGIIIFPHIDNTQSTGHN